MVMFAAFSLAHRLRVLIEALLHGFEHMLMLPSGNAPEGCRRALGFERAGRAGRRPVMAQRLAILLIRKTIGQFLARRAAIDILRGQIDKVLFAEPAICLRTRGHRLWQRDRNVGLLACQNLGAVEVATIGDDIEMVGEQNVFRLGCHFGKL